MCGSCRFGACPNVRFTGRYSVVPAAVIGHSATCQISIAWPLSTNWLWTFQTKAGRAYKTIVNFKEPFSLVRRFKMERAGGREDATCDAPPVFLRQPYVLLR